MPDRYKINYFSHYPTYSILTGFLLHQHHPMPAPDQLSCQIQYCSAAALATVHRTASGHSHHQYSAMKLDIERHVNHTPFGPKPFKDCRKMGNNAIFESVVNQ